jgi:stearoyl-CoA desaturase (delta-9 desaturase)
MVNALGHAVGSRNFDLPDNSRNNHLAAWLILGEGFQNNHHRYPASPRFSYRAYEIDLGYAACLTMEAIGAVKIERSLLMPRPGDVVTETVPATETAGSAV